jgi:hypothetical protein
MKNSPRQLFPLHQALQLALWIGAGSVLLASAKPRFVRQTASSLQGTRFHCSRVHWRRALHHSSQRMALHMVILGLRLLGHGNPFHEAPDGQLLC